MSGLRETTQNHIQLDVSGLKKRENNDKGKIYQEFKGQRRRSQKGWYETSLLWKTNSDELPTNKV